MLVIRCRSLAIHRAILDQGTCYLDPAAEARSERAFAARAGSLIMIARRISSAQRANRIIVLDGTEAMLGTHAELVWTSPLSTDLVGGWAVGPS